MYNLEKSKFTCFCKVFNESQNICIDFYLLRKTNPQSVHSFLNNLIR